MVQRPARHSAGRFLCLEQITQNSFFNFYDDNVITNFTYFFKRYDELGVFGRAAKQLSRPGDHNRLKAPRFKLALGVAYVAKPPAI